MRWRRSAPVLGACLALAGCGGIGSHRDLRLADVPLPRGARIATSAHVCNPGANAYCAEQLVVVGDRYASSADLLTSENRRLKKLGWQDSRGQTPKQLAANSGGNTLRLYLDTAYNDLVALDIGQIHRTARIGRSLSATIFDRQSAISLMLVRGTT